MTASQISPRPVLRPRRLPARPGTLELARHGRVHVVDRGFLTNYVFGARDVVVALGQDGLVANVLKYLDGQPVIGVNPDPARWDGVLLPFAVGDLDRLPPPPPPRRPPPPATRRALPPDQYLWRHRRQPSNATRRQGAPHLRCSGSIRHPRDVTRRWLAPRYRAKSFTRSHKAPVALLPSGVPGLPYNS